METNTQPENKTPAHGSRTVLYIVIAVVVLLVAGGALYMVLGNKDATPSTTTPSSPSTPTSPSSTSNVTWQSGNSGWEASGTLPACPTPLTLKSPVDLSKVTAILYPGQTRGTDYKPHGGFRFDSNTTTVTAPMDAQVVEGSRYIEQGETQYLFTFIAPCGIMYRFDHLLTLSAVMQKLADQLPAAKQDDSRTTSFDSPITVKAGDALATAVGFPKSNNASVDWGVYDLRQKNEASKTAAYTQAHPGQMAQHGVCWFDFLSSADEATVRGLPAGDQANGKTSDYCK